MDYQRKLEKCIAKGKKLKLNNKGCRYFLSLIKENQEMFQINSIRDEIQLLGKAFNGLNKTLINRTGGRTVNDPTTEGKIQKAAAPVAGLVVSRPFKAPAEKAMTPPEAPLHVKSGVAPGEIINLSEFLIKYREENNNLSKLGLAKKIGISDLSVAKMERGESISKPVYEKLIKLIPEAKNYKVPISKWGSKKTGEKAAPARKKTKTSSEESKGMEARKIIRSKLREKLWSFSDRLGIRISKICEKYKIEKDYFASLFGMSIDELSRIEAGQPIPEERVRIIAINMAVADQLLLDNVVEE